MLARNVARVKQPVSSVRTIRAPQRTAKSTPATSTRISSYNVNSRLPNFAPRFAMRSSALYHTSRGVGAQSTTGKLYEDYIKMANELAKQKAAKEEAAKQQQQQQQPEKPEEPADKEKTVDAEVVKKYQEELAAKDKELEELKAKYDELTAKYEKDTKELRDRLLESYADRENLRRIMSKDIENAKEFGIKKFAVKLFDVIDTMDIVLNNLPEKSDDPTVAAAREAFVVSKQAFIKVMKEYGVEELVPQIGDKFDPHIHDALFTTEPTAEGQKANHISLVYKNGWMRNGQALRAAQVGVFSRDFTPASEAQKTEGEAQKTETETPASS